MNTCTLQHWIELTCSNTQAFSMLSWSAGRPSIFHCSCSLSLARKRLKSKCSNFKWSIHKERSWRRTSSGVYTQHGRIEQCLLTCIAVHACHIHTLAHANTYKYLHPHLHTVHCAQVPGVVLTCPRYVMNPAASRDCCGS